jgi:hypothetical protein
MTCVVTWSLKRILYWLVTTTLWYGWQPLLLLFKLIVLLCDGVFSLNLIQLIKNLGMLMHCLAMSRIRFTTSLLGDIGEDQFAFFRVDLIELLQHLVEINVVLVWNHKAALISILTRSTGVFLVKKRRS